VLVVCVESGATVVTQSCSLQGCTTAAACAAMQVCLLLGQGLVRVDTSAHARVALPTRMGCKLTVRHRCYHIRGPFGQAGIGLLACFSRWSSFMFLWGASAAAAWRIC
jgi:hypothetical protein